MSLPDSTASVEAAITKPVWAEPEIVVEPVRDTAADPTINDDGLGNGVFS